MQERPYWLEVSPRPAAVGRAELPQRTDVAVIGGGYTGISAARVLAGAGAQVTVIERSLLGAGASTRNAGMVLPGFRRGAQSLVTSLGAVRARELFDASRAAVFELEELATGEAPALPCDYRLCGHLRLATTPKQYIELQRDARVFDKVMRHETELVPGDRLEPELGASIPYAGALLDPLAGSLDPAKLFWGLVAAAQRARVTLVEGVDVLSLRREADRFLLRTSHGTLGAKDVVVATGGYGDPVVPALRRRVYFHSSTTITTAPLGHHVARMVMQRDRVVTDMRECMTWFRLTPDTRMIFGAEAPFRSSTRTERLRTLSEAMCAHFPRLLGTDIDYQWGGSVAMTRDRLPHAGERDGVYYALGCNGHGIPLALYLGARVAASVIGKDDLEPFESLKFSALPRWYLPVLGTVQRLRDRVKSKRRER
ncbi:MAG TPA: FAD-binding oxidoreductase [Gemmatimonadales bacterium]|nr:FAD-binding oxidoreductase [Gemmatimonadales bacterium]